ncbi:hypothetical protein [Aureicoccus marinus]|uniref:Prepilin type IV endopeptidase peptidase domain-containing protein n=1 Tax=Aureicoccus marinus TaxID=754435 RepID=A0A2S7T5V0_9FLAO|nr:hypothetical protein [Aureicoccus marinus]PQJ15310.1 hypothetical protein BST99_05780 [Aureicoccus marinus]
MLLGIVNILGLLWLAYQDFKERAVWAMLFPVLALLMAIRLYHSTDLNVFLLYISMNSALVLLIIALLWGYTRYIHKIPFLNHAIGAGDLWFFFVLALAFPTPIFVVLFSCSLLFSLMLSVFLRVEKNRIPLAGFMALFVSITLILSLINLFPDPYQF